ncbi:MAG: hypothetical protein ILA06_01355 [Bacteroidaceae bacterium]|nr:hypothetical protein [Bacteroidaceae bacterium]
MRKFYSLFFALLTVCGLAQAQVVFDFANNNLDLPISATGAEDEGNVTEISSEGVTITFDKGTASTNSRLWSASGNITLRVYKGSTFTVSADENITSIVFGGQASNFGLDASPEGLDGQTWTGSAKSITFSPTKTNQIRTITVTVGEGGDTPDPELPEYTTIAAVKDAATVDKVNVVFKANDLLVTFVNGKNVYVYDGTDGLLLYANDASLNEGIKAGDKITADVKGQLYLYNGLTEIAVSAYENLTVNSSDNAVEPQKVTIADVTNSPKDYENELVQIEGLYAQAEALANRNINFMDDSDNEIVVRDNWNVLTGTTFDTESEYSVTAFVALYNGKVQLYPRTAEDVTNGETPQPYEFTGDGSLENPYTVEDIQHKEATSTKEALETGVWVKAYIVGYINGSSLSESTAIFSADAPEGTDKDGNPLTVTASNIIVADVAGASTIAAVIPVGTVNKSVARENLNLADNPGMLGQQVWLKGDIFKYMGVSGLKNVSEYSLNGSDIVTAISTVEAAAAQGAIYTIAGQRIQHINRAGLYIVGGKKVAVK